MREIERERKGKRERISSERIRKQRMGNKPQHRSFSLTFHLFRARNREFERLQREKKNENKTV